MTTFASKKVDRQLSNKLKEDLDPSADSKRLIKIRPPQNNNGLEASLDLLRSFHTVRTENKFMSGQKNTSKLTGIEIWYEEQELSFIISVSDKETEMDYRRQIDGYFKGSQISKQSERFVEANENEYISAANVWLANHYLEPIKNQQGAKRWKDPYQMLFNGLDARDGSRSIIQVLFKPAFHNWAENKYMKPESQAEKFRSPKKESLFMGFFSQETPPSSEQKAYANQIENRKEKPAFHVNIRYAVISETASKCIRQAEKISELFESGYRAVSGQTLKSHPAESSKEIQSSVEKIVNRKTVNMTHPSTSFGKWKHANFKDHSKHMILTLSELGSLVHIPSTTDVSSNAIAWNKTPVKGTLPYNANRFNRLPEEKRKKQLIESLKDKEEIKTKYGLDQLGNKFSKKTAGKLKDNNGN